MELADSIRPVCTPSAVEVPLELVVKPPRSQRWLEVLPPPFAKHSPAGRGADREGVALVAAGHGTTCMPIAMANVARATSMKSNGCGSKTLLLPLRSDR